MVKLEYELKGNNRKPLIQAIEELTGRKAVYLKTPSMAYEIGAFKVSKNGTVTSNSDESLEELKENLASTYKISLPKANVGQHKVTCGLTVEMPKDKVNTVKLAKILENKGSLIKEALNVSNLEIKETSDTILFPWFDGIDEAHFMTYAKFIAMLCKMSVDVKRINDTKHEAVNKKYAFRCFLLRLGFIGDEYKQDRKILLERLEGSSAFRNGGTSDASSK